MSVDILTCEGGRSKRGQAGQQIKDCHLDQRVLAVPAFQHPLAHLREEGAGVVSKREQERERGACWDGGGALATYLIKFLLHQVSATPTLHQGGLRWAGGSPEPHEALVRAVPQQSHQGIGLRGLDGLETGEGGNVARFRPKAHEVLAVLVMHELLLCDFFHFFSQALYGWGRQESALLTTTPP